MTLDKKLTMAFDSNCLDVSLLRRTCHQTFLPRFSEQLLHDTFMRDWCVGDMWNTQNGDAPGPERDLNSDELMNYRQSQFTWGSLLCFSPGSLLVKSALLLLDARSLSPAAIVSSFPRLYQLLTCSIGTPSKLPDWNTHTYTTHKHRELQMFFDAQLLGPKAKSVRCSALNI